MENNQEIEKIIESSLDTKKCRQIIAIADEYFKKHNIQLEDYRKHSLVNHIAEMIKRSILGEKIDNIDGEMFEEISKESIDFANEIVLMVGNLPSCEKYLLSVHFETAKNA